MSRIEKVAPLGTLAPKRNKAGGIPTYLVPFSVGDGRPEILLTTTGWSDFLQDVNDECAFCHGDPCAERSNSKTLIGNYFARNSWAQTCPCCDGKAS